MSETLTVAPHDRFGKAVKGPVLMVHPGAELYGSDRMLLESVDALVAAGTSVTVALPAAGPLVAELVARGADVVTCPMPVIRKSALRPLGLVKLLRDVLVGVVPAARLIRSRGAGGVYVNTLTIPTWLVLARLLRRPVVSHVHEAERSAPRLVRWALTVPALCAHRIVVNSEYSLTVLVESQPRVAARSVVVYNAVSGPAQQVAARPRIDGPLRVLYVGRLSPRKGPDVALAAVAEVIRRGGDVRLDLLGSVFTGYEWFATELEQAAAEPDLAGRVTFLGFEADVWPRLADADVIVIPSVVDEPFGNTAVEAILAARPAVVSATSGLLEAAGGYDSVVMVDPGDVAGLAAALERIRHEWRTYAAVAETDAMRAADRHGASRYRDAIVAALSAAGALR